MPNTPTIDVTRLEIRDAQQPGLSDVSVDLTAIVADVPVKVSAVLTIPVRLEASVAQLQLDVVAILHAALEPDHLRLKRLQPPP